MILIRPLIRANAARAHNAHVVVFFIFLVANIGGALTPLGDPPLFVGFLRGVDFFWTAQHLWLQTLIVAAAGAGDLLRARHVGFRREDRRSRRAKRRRADRAFAASSTSPLIARHHRARSSLRRSGSPASHSTSTAPTLALQNLARDAALMLIALASLWLTPNEHRAANGFTWEPIREVAKLFAGIFVCHHPGAGDAASRPRRRVRLAAARRHRARTARRTRPPISG